MIWFVLGGLAIVGLWYWLQPEAFKAAWATVKGWFSSDDEPKAE